MTDENLTRRFFEAFQAMRSRELRVSWEQLTDVEKNRIANRMRLILAGKASPGRGEKEALDAAREHVT